MLEKYPIFLQYIFIYKLNNFLKVIELIDKRRHDYHINYKIKL